MSQPYRIEVVSDFVCPWCFIGTRRLEKALEGKEAEGLAGSDALESELEVVRNEAREASAEGITGVPFFVFGGKIAVSGAQPPEVFQKALSMSA